MGNSTYVAINKVRTRTKYKQASMVLCKPGLHLVIIAYPSWSSYSLWSFCCCCSHHRHCCRPVVVLPLLLPHCCVLPSPCHCSTCNPPHEQFLMRLGVGGVLSCVPSLSLLPTHSCPPILVLILLLTHCCHIIILLSSFSHCCVPASPCHCSTHNPPHEQLLMRLGVGGVSLCVVSCLSLVPILVVIHLVSRGSQWWWGGTVNGVVLLL
jgi:hypothetical protein